MIPKTGHRRSELMEEELARLAREIAAALEGFARRIAAGDVAQRSELEDALDREPYLGFRQRQILLLPGMATEEGLTTGDVSKSTGISQPNAHLTLKGLVLRGLVEKHE